jgi:mannose-6-phosphate isomerase-like protein (cupin superfamily)
MTRILAIVLLLAQAGTTKTPAATDVKASDIQATVKEEIAKKLTDIPIRTVDAGGHNVSVAVVHRDKGTNLTGMASHDKVSEVYYVVEGSGTFVTGGALVKPQKREASSDTVKQLSGPGSAGAGITGGVSRKLSKGDMVIIPAGTPHGFSEVQETITYTIVRVDPARVIALK